MKIVQRMGLAWRIGLLMSALVAGLVLAGAAAVWLRTQRLAGPALDRAIVQARDLVDEAVAVRLDRLDLVTRLLVNDPPFRAYVAEGDAVSTFDNLADRRELYACDVLLIVDATGSVLADTRRRPPAPRPEPMVGGAAPPILAAALAGEPARGVVIDPRGGLYLAAAAPFPAGEAAALLAMDELDGSLANTLSRASGAHLSFFMRGGPGARAVATTLPLSATRMSQLLSTAALSPSAGPARVAVEGEEFAVLAGHLPSGGPEPAAGYLAMRSVDLELAPFRKIQTALVVTGLAAIPLALALGVVVARRITKPVAALARATERVRAGDYDAPIPPDTGDEVGALAAGFRTMVAQLKEKEEMDAWIGRLAAGAAGSSIRHRDTLPPGGDSDLPTRALPQPHPVTVAPGSLLNDRFRLLEPIGAGGMGSVWKARDERLGEMVAIKVLPAPMAASPEMAERFRQEIRLARRVTHRNVLRTHELLELPGTWAILMELVDGVPLDRVLAAGRLPRAAALRIARQICDGLEAAHAQGVVHRDLKPGNILVDTAGCVKIADFGLARSTTAGGGMTRSGTILGTPLYMSPEQAQGREADQRSDIYSAGVLFYEILCGRRPFEGTSDIAILKAHVETPPPPPRSINPELDPALEAVLLRALSKDPGERFATARDLSDALAAADRKGAPA